MSDAIQALIAGDVIPAHRLQRFLDFCREGQILVNDVLENVPELTRGMIEAKEAPTKAAIEKAAEYLNTEAVNITGPFRQGI